MNIIRRTLWVLVFIGLTVSCVLNFLTHQRLQRIGLMMSCSTIHKPKSGCPEGWVLGPGYFHEQDGTSEDACQAPEGTQTKVCIDELRPGEGVEIHIPIRVPERRKEPTT